MNVLSTCGSPTRLQKPVMPESADPGKLERFIRDVKYLPPAPTILTQLLRLFRQPDRDIDQVVQVINRDPSLTAEVLRRCNSAVFAGECPVVEMYEAVARLGFYEIYRTVVSLFGARAMSLPSLTADLQAGLWRHSIATAILAGNLARELEENQSAAFTAGLLHDIGKVLFAARESHQYAELVKLCGLSGGRLAEEERKYFDCDHSEVGAHLLSSWNLPPEIVSPVRQHHRLESGSSVDRLNLLVSTANRLSHSLGPTSDGEPNDSREAADLLTSLDLSPTRLPGLLLQTRSDLKLFGALVPPPIGKPIVY